MSSISSKLWCFSPTIHCRKVICADYIYRSRTEAFSGIVKRTLLTQMDSLLSNHGKCEMSVKHINPLQSSFSKTLLPDKLAGFRNSSPLSGCSVYCFDRKHNKLLDYNGQLGKHLQQLDKYCTYQKDKGQTKSQEKDKNIGDILEKENVFTVPNMLTMSRIVLTPFLGYLVLQEYFAMATGIFVIAGVTDLLDGYIARNFKNQTSAFGSFLDPLADKLLVSVLYVSLTMVHLIPVPLAVLVILRDVLLIAGAFYVRYISLPAPRTLSQYFNATKASAELKPLFISKLNTALQLFLVAVSLTAPVFDFVNHPFLQFLWYATAATTVASGAGYTFAKGTFRELRKKTF